MGQKVYLSVGLTRIYRAEQRKLADGTGEVISTVDRCLGVF